MREMRQYLENELEKIKIGEELCGQEGGMINTRNREKNGGRKWLLI